MNVAEFFYSSNFEDLYHVRVDVELECVRRIAKSIEHNMSKRIVPETHL